MCYILSVFLKDAIFLKHQPGLFSPQERMILLETILCPKVFWAISGFESCKKKLHQYSLHKA